MNILHITDFHYANENSLQTRIVKSIINSLTEQKLNIDLIFFTGDLVQNGNKIENFNAASKALFEVLSEKLNVQKENIIFCSGNHDIDRSAIHGAMKPFFDANVNSDNSLNEFYKKKSDSVYSDSIKPSIKFNSFLTEYHSGDKNIQKDLYSIHFRNVKGKSIGIVCINSSWISALDKEKTGKDDKGNLLIPHDLLEEVKRDLGKVDKKILLIHHPLYFLKDFNFYGIESFIHNEFDLMFSGHVHKVSSISRHSGSNGIFEHVAKASLSAKENLGCSLIEIDDIEENIIRVKEVTCIDDNDGCFIGKEIIHTIPCGPEKIEILAFRKKLFDKILIEKEYSNNLLLLNDNEEKEDFLTLFNHPVLKKESEGGLETKSAPSIPLEELVLCNKNYLILGKDKCGKTSLLKRIQIDCLINYSRNGKIPFFFDARELESKLDSNFDIEQIIRSYFGINKAKVQQILASKDFLLLIDNYSPNSPMASYLNNLLDKYPDISFIICSEFNLSRTVDIFQLGKSLYDKLYFHDLRRTEIVEYTDKRLSTHQKKAEVQEKIIQLCKQLELPLNYWTISLLLLIHNKSTDSYSKNLFSVLDVCVDEIFGKKQLLIAHSRLSFEQLKKICAELAKELFNNHKETVYSASFQDVLGQITKTIAENDRISANSRDIFNYLVVSGIIKKKNENDYYVFRLNGFFEYFLALQMTKDIAFKNEILEDDVKYLAFKNQLEIYSGFKRDDLQFLQTVFAKSKNKIASIFQHYNIDKDKELLNKIQEPTLIENFCKELSIKKTLSSVEKAKLEDFTDELQIDADVHKMKEMNPDAINSELLERYLSILARVFRNMDEISGSKDKISEIFNNLINWYCDFGFYIIDEFSQITKQEIEKEGCVDIQDFPELELLKFISNFSPFISQMSFFDGLGHFNLERMVKDEIKKLEESSKTNQFKLYMLYFLLLDIDLNANKEYIQIAMDKIKIPILKYSIFIKLNYYLAFKGGENKSLQHDLSKNIQKAKLNLDNKTDIGDIQKQIQVKKRMRLVNKNNL
jgi:predicted MPP superfamily phosphohydrolase